MGVDVFFVISGYVITRKYFPQMTEGTFGFWKFYQARARRLLPALSIVIGATVIFGGFILLPLRYENLGLQGIAGSLFFPNFLAWTEVGYFDAAAETKPLLHLWSLGIEEQFYLLWPLLLILFARTQKKAIAFLAVIVVASLIYSIIDTDLSQATACYRPAGSPLGTRNRAGLSRSPIPDSKRRNIVSFSASYSSYAARPFSQNQANSPAGVLRPCCRIRPDTRLRREFLGAPVTHRGRKDQLPRLPVALAPDHLRHDFRSYICVDHGTHRHRQFHSSLANYCTGRNSNSLRTSQPARACYCSLDGRSRPFDERRGMVQQRPPQRYPAEIRSVIDTMRYDPVAGARAQTCWIANTATSEFGKECSAGQTLIWGDSHAGRLYTGFSEDRDGQVAQFTRDACLPSFGTNSTVCERSNNDIVNRIAELKPDKLIIFAFWTHLVNSEELKRSQMSSLARAVVELRKSVKQIVILGPRRTGHPTCPAGL